MILNEREKKALEFYIGTVSGNDPFWSDPKAYVVINALFFPDAMAERARAAEGKYLNPEIISNPDRLSSFFADMFSVFEKCRAEKDYTVYRVERYCDYCIMRERSATVSFTSTSTAGFLSEYRDRKGIVLMKFDIPKGTNCIDMAEVLDAYGKADEEEILLPPDMKLEITECEVSEEEMAVTDSDNKPPVLSCTVRIAENWNVPREFPVPRGEYVEKLIALYNELNQKFGNIKKF